MDEVPYETGDEARERLTVAPLTAQTTTKSIQDWEVQMMALISKTEVVRAFQEWMYKSFAIPLDCEEPRGK